MHNEAFLSLPGRLHPCPRFFVRQNKFWNIGFLSNLVQNLCRDVILQQLINNTALLRRSLGQNCFGIVFMLDQNVEPFFVKLYGCKILLFCWTRILLQIDCIFSCFTAWFFHAFVCPRKRPTSCLKMNDILQNMIVLQQITYIYY